MSARERPDDVPPELLSRYGFAEGTAVTPLGGEIKSNWVIGHPGSVLHVYPRGVPLAAVEQELAWTSALGSAVPEIPTAITSSRGRLVEVTESGSAAVLTRFFEGHAPDGSAESRASMAEVLGRMHRRAQRLGLGGEAWFPALRRFDWTTNPWWTLGDLASEKELRALVSAAEPELEAVPGVLSRLDGLPECLVHNDVHRGNLIARGPRIVGIVDWDWAAIDWRVLDVAGGMRSWLRPGETDLTSALDFVDRYSEAVGDFTDDEWQCLPDVLWLRSLWTVFYDFGRARRHRLDKPGVAYRVTAHAGIRDSVYALRRAIADHRRKR